MTSVTFNNTHPRGYCDLHCCQNMRLFNYQHSVVLKNVKDESIQFVENTLFNKDKTDTAVINSENKQFKEFLRQSLA